MQKYKRNPFILNIYFSPSQQVLHSAGHIMQKNPEEIDKAAVSFAKNIY